MPSPYPKPPELRQRQNKASTRATLIDDGEQREIPSLPPRPRQADGKRREWRKLTREWWRDIWLSPMGSEYGRSDYHALLILADLIDRYWAAPSAALAGEIRLQGQLFGLTPLDRRRLEWSIKKVQPKDQQQQQPSAPRAEAAADDPRRALRAVQ
mgnify:CR=1 FL=1